jgi:hypothetical protein
MLVGWSIKQEGSRGPRVRGVGKRTKFKLFLYCDYNDACLQISSVLSDFSIEKISLMCLCVCGGGGLTSSVAAALTLL